jgi:hypothetical protein
MHAATSDDASYSAPCIKSTVNTCSAENHISEWRIFKMLKTLKPDCNGNAQYLGLVSAFRCSVPQCRDADLMNLSVLPQQWKSASIPRIPKISTPLLPSDYTPIYITPVLSRILQRNVVTGYIHPSLSYPPPGLTFSDQFAFQPAGSTTAAMIHPHNGHKYRMHDYSPNIDNGCHGVIINSLPLR